MSNQNSTTIHEFKAGALASRNALLELRKAFNSIEIDGEEDMDQGKYNHLFDTQRDLIISSLYSNFSNLSDFQKGFIHILIDCADYGLNDTIVRPESRMPHSVQCARMEVNHVE